MTASEQHQTECDLDRNTLHSLTKDHESRLRAVETSVVRIEAKLLVWSGVGSFIGVVGGGLIVKLL